MRGFFGDEYGPEAVIDGAVVLLFLLKEEEVFLAVLKVDAPARGLGHISQGELTVILILTLNGPREGDGGLFQSHWARLVGVFDLADDAKNDGVGGFDSLSDGEDSDFSLGRGREGEDQGEESDCFKVASHDGLRAGVLFVLPALGLWWGGKVPTRELFLHFVC